MDRPISTVLVVDDNAKNIQLLMTLLSKDGYLVSFASNGREALEMAEKEIPDLILLDIMMPGMDGFEVCQKLKMKENLKHIPVIFLSARSDLIDKIKAFHVGGADYVAKPFHSAEVLARVNTLLALKHAQDLIKVYNTKLEELVLKRTQELIVSEKHAAFSLFIKGIIHNLKNPLNAISGNIQLLKIENESLEKLDHSDKDEYIKQSGILIQKLQKRLDLMSDSTNQLGELINSLLAKSRDEQKEQFSEYDLNELLSKEIEFLKSDLRFKREVKTKIKLYQKPIKINTTPGHISQLVQNLVHNALDALSGQENGEIQIRTTSSKRWGILKITDNGPGISVNDQSKIFDPFFTTKPGESDGPEPVGTGLGLYTCKDIVARLEGMISVESDGGKGTAFIVKLPLSS